jgi:hypothetical protein
MTAKPGGTYRLSRRGMAVLTKYGRGGVTDTLLYLDQQVQILRAKIEGLEHK